MHFGTVVLISHPMHVLRSHGEVSGRLLACTGSAISAEFENTALILYGLHFHCY